MATAARGSPSGGARRPLPSRRGGAVGATSAHAAYLEAASISAFHTLGEELALTVHREAFEGAQRGRHGTRYGMRG